MKKIIAGHFKYEVIKQTVMINVVRPKKGDDVTPAMSTVEQSTEIDVRQRTWIEQQEVELNADDLAQRAVDEETHIINAAKEVTRRLTEAKHTLRNKLTMKFSELALVDKDQAQLKAKYKTLLAGIDAITTTEEAEIFEF